MAQRDWAEKDYYDILGVSKEASKEEIKRAYRKLAQRYHPDANEGGKEAETRFKEISEAHSILSNDEKRREYDQMRAFVQAGGQRFFGFRPGGGGENVRVTIGDLFGDDVNAGDLFGDLFGFGGRGGRAAAGQDLETEARLTFDEAVNGATLTLSGAKVRVPPGVRDGARIRVPGKGRPGPGGGRPGDLYVRVGVEPHPVFSLGDHGELWVKVPLTFAEAALGAEVDVPTLDGSVRVKIPPGTPNGKVLRVKGQGVKRNRGVGDLLVRVEVEVPQKLGRRERRLLEEFAAEHKASPRAHLDELIAKTKRKVS